MDEPWLKYQTNAPTSDGPWTRYAPPKQAESYTEKVGRTGEAFDKAAGPGLKGVGRTAVAAGETALAMGSGLVGDVAGAATSIATQNPETGKKVRSALTYEPKTEAGKAAGAYVGAITEPVANLIEAGPKYLEEHGHPILGQTARAAIDIAGGKKALESKPVKAAVESSINADMVAKARAAGYVLKPSEAGGKVGKVAEGLSGSPRMSIEASLKNQPVTNKLAATEIGVPGKVTRASLSVAKKPHNAVYKEVSELGDVTTTPDYKSEIASIGRTPGKSFQKHSNPEIDGLRSAFMEDTFNSKDAVLKVRQLRASSSKNIRAPNAPEKNELGYAQRQVADAIDNELERTATAQGKGDLVSRFKDARKSLAKIHSVESALVGNTGDVSATRLAKMQQKGVPLSGNLKLIADVADEFGEVTRDATKLKNKVPVTVLEGGVGAAGAVMTAAHNPAVGLPMLGGMVARPAIRKALLSEAYQKRLGKGVSKVKDLPKKRTEPMLGDADAR